MNPRHLLIDTLAHIPPMHALEGLDAADAERRLPGAAHSIAEIVAHMSFWQDWWCVRCEGIATPIVANAAGGWPAVAEGSWPSIQHQFVAGLERTAALGGTDPDRAIVPAIEFPPLGNYSLRAAQEHVAQHNAHHLGQVILLRQMMGRWPPPAGSWTW
jgi:uncharacterized damage-inducible protein DinB